MRHRHVWIPVTGVWRYCGRGKGGRMEDSRDTYCPCGQESFDIRPHVHTASSSDSVCSQCGSLLPRDKVNREDK